MRFRIQVETHSQLDFHINVSRRRHEDDIFRVKNRGSQATCTHSHGTMIPMLLSHVIIKRTFSE